MAISNKWITKYKHKKLKEIHPVFLDKFQSLFICRSSFSLVVLSVSFCVSHFIFDASNTSLKFYHVIKSKVKLLFGSQFLKKGAFQNYVSIDKDLMKQLNWFLISVQ